MFRTISLLLLAFLLTFKISAQEKPKKRCYTKEGYVKAEVIHSTIENCGYLIVLCDKDKTKLAGKLTDEFKKDKQKIWLKYWLAKKQPMSTCMTGKSIEILDIHKR